jgi:hypothetical protein
VPAKPALQLNFSVHQSDPPSRSPQCTATADPACPAEWCHVLPARQPLLRSTTPAEATSRVRSRTNICKGGTLLWARSCAGHQPVWRRCRGNPKALITRLHCSYATRFSLCWLPRSGWRCRRKPHCFPEKKNKLDALWTD